MQDILKKVSSPLLALFIICMGNSLLTTLVALRMDDLGVGNFMVGVASSCFYLGMVIGAFKIESFVSRFGHIRSYAAIAALIAVSGLMHIISGNPFLWCALRFFSGLAVAGMYVVIESWLLTFCDNKNRAQILSIYMVALYASQSLGQFFINVGDKDSIIPFVIVGILANLSIIPLALTTSPQPVYQQPSVLTLKKLYLISPSGIMGCFMSGMMLSVLYGLLPRALEEFRYSELHISYLMATLIFGGMALQYPFGWLADKFNKRTILMLLCALTALVSLAIFVFIFGNSITFYWMLFLLGGLSFVLYPIAMSHTCDYADPRDVVSVTGGLVLVYGAGCVLGPLVAPAFMSFFGSLGVFSYLAMCGAGLGIFVFYRTSQRPALPPEAQAHVVVQNPHLTPIANEIDPRFGSQKSE